MSKNKTDGLDQYGAEAFERLALNGLRSSILLLTMGQLSQTELASINDIAFPPSRYVTLWSLSGVLRRKMRDVVMPF